MKPIPVLGIPFLNRVDLLLRCIDSIDYPVDKLVIVNNSGERGHDLLTYRSLGEMVNYAAQSPAAEHIGEIVEIVHPNAGVSASWNEIIKLFPGPGRTGEYYWMLVNNDIRFTPGDLGRFVSFIEESTGIKDTKCPACYYGNHGASFWAVSALGIREVGLFDENLFPAYLEDCDWSRRADLLGLARINVPGIEAEHGYGAVTGSCTIMSDPKVRENNHRTHGGNFEYYRQKWGGNNGEEVFNHPFNNPAIPMWAWRFEPGFRQSQLSKIV